MFSLPLVACRLYLSAGTKRQFYNMVVSLLFAGERDVRNIKLL